MPNGIGLEEVIYQHFEKIKLYVKNANPQKRRQLQLLLERACTLDPQKSLYLFAKAYFFPSQDSIEYICEAKVLNTKWEAGSLLDIYTGKLVEVCLEKQQSQVATHHVQQHRFSSHTMHIADMYYQLHEFSRAQRAYENYFLTNVNYVNSFPLRKDYATMATIYFIQQKPNIGKYFVDYLYELIRRHNWHKKNISKMEFIENIKSSHPMIKKYWK